MQWRAHRSLVQDHAAVSILHAGTVAQRVDQAQQLGLVLASHAQQSVVVTRQQRDFQHTRDGLHDFLEFVGIGARFQLDVDIGLQVQVECGVVDARLETEDGAIGHQAPDAVGHRIGAEAHALAKILKTYPRIIAQ